MKNKVMKKVLTIAICLGMVAAMVGCGSKTDKASTDSKTTSETTEQTSSDANTSSDKVEKEFSMSGSGYSGKANMSMTVKPDGTATANANGNNIEGTWEYSEDSSCFIKVHFEADGQVIDLEVTKNDDGTYSAPVPSVPDMVLTGK